MRIIITAFLIINTLACIGQGYGCDCDFMLSGVEKEHRPKCDTTFLSNGAMMYWQWNCDSAWFTFEMLWKTVLKSCQGADPSFCQRTGLNFLKEYPTYLLFKWDWISGCCAPPDILFLDKKEAKELRRIAHTEFVWGSTDENFITFFADTLLEKLVYLELEDNKEYFVSFSSGEVIESARKNGGWGLKELFTDFKKSPSHISMVFKQANGAMKEIKIPR